jgi:hypothetical protein
LSVEGLGIESLSRDRLAGAIARRLVDHFNRMPTKE